jgi:putative membrane protein
MKISDQEKNEIKKLIASTETKAACEIVPMVVDISDNYPAAHFRLAIIVSFIFSLGLYYSPLSFINPIYYLWIQIPGLIAGYLLANIKFFKRLFITRHEMNQEVTQRAYEAFMHHNLHLTKGHNGLLIFISTFERKIKIISDNGIKSKVEDQVWNNVIKNFVTIIRNENFFMALKATIRSVGEILAVHFPAENHTENELGNELIIE